MKLIAIKVFECWADKVDTGSMEANSNAGGKVSSLDCTLEIGKLKNTSDDPLKEVYLLGASF